MWMQKSVEGSSFSGGGNFHDRNRFGSPYASGGSYGGGSAAADGAGDWKSKILESGQWLGGKVIEYGGKLARGPTSDSIPDHYAPQMPRNDGRANWMADIRSSSGGGTGGYAGGYTGNGGGYQNDFATERPKTYSDFGNGAPKPYEPKNLSMGEHGHKSRHVKKKSEKKKSRKNKKKQPSESESEEEVSESSETESADERHKKVKAKKKTQKKKKSGFYSESESSDDGGKKKASKDYAFSFDPAKLPPPPVEEEKKKSKKKHKKEKASKKSRARRHSVASTDDESTSEKENTRKAKKRGSKKAAASSASVDLLGVDLDVQQVQPVAGLSTQEVQPSIFDAPLNQNPLQDLAGLSFAAAPAQAAAPTQPSVFHVASEETQPQQQAEAFRTNLLPENNIVDFNSLASEKKKKLSANPAEKRTLNDLQKARGADQPTPVMAMPMQGQSQMQNMPMQLSMNMNQLQLTDGSIQQQMYPNMQMQGMSQQQQMMMMQPQMGMMAQPQMMNMQIMQQHQQQFAQGQQQTMNVASKSKSSDPFHQL